MADPALLDVVRTALGIPDSFGNLSYDQQVKILTPRVDLTKFRTTAGITKFVDQYLAQDEIKQGKMSSNPLLGLFKGGSSSNQGLTLGSKMLNLLA